MDRTALEANPWMIAPFGALLGLIALAPWLCPRWWGKYYPAVAGGLGCFTAAYYLLGLRAGARLAEVGHEYFSFIALIGSLYVVAGGIHLRVKGEATPHVNVLFLLVGAVLANVLGTTGAAMVLIRPWIRMNRFRVTAHHIVFFIFVVANVGGCLTPVGDPPLFLGYLKGIPFWWVAQHCWPMWATGVGFLLAMFYVLDTLNYRRTPRAVRAELTREPEQWRLQGLWNLAWLAVIMGAVFVSQPRFLREGLMIGAAVGAWFTTPASVRDSNRFDFHPLREVVILFAGIFATMVPALDWLEHHAGSLGGSSPAFFYWSSGLLSSLLDNAPTYLSFLSALFGLLISPEAVEQVQALIASQGTSGPHDGPVWLAYQALMNHHAVEAASGAVAADHIQTAFLVGNPGLASYVLALGLGAVFFGANTYIGNGPNFMVKAIAEHEKIHMPGFLGFIFKYTLPCMGPTLVLIWLLFLRG